MLKIEKVKISFHGIAILRDLSCEVGASDLVTIMGHNGAGKSTLFDIIAGKTMPDEGHVILGDDDVTALSEQQRASSVGRLFQNTYHGSVATMTVRENIAMATYKGRAAGLQCGVATFPSDVVDEVLAPLGLNLEKLLDVPMGMLSGGQRQILSFIMATLVPPEVLLLDEPTAALDPRSAAMLVAFIQEYVATHRIPTLLITHDKEIAAIGTKQWALQEGKLVERKSHG